MRTWALALLVGVVGCGRASPPPDLPNENPLGVDADAEIQNAQKVDGCRLLIIVGDERFGPDAASVAMLDAFVGTTQGTQVKLSFQLTGLPTTVRCGDRNVLTVPEVSIQSVAAR